ncbi:uncharacterized protein C1orf87 homolog [Lissotriton helveticus]
MTSACAPRRGLSVNVEADNQVQLGVKVDEAFDGSYSTSESVKPSIGCHSTSKLVKLLIGCHSVYKWDLKMDNANEKTSRPLTQPVHQVANLKDSKRHESWIERFGKLEKALCLCDTKNTGQIEKERAKRLIHNYNHIYNLTLSPLRIDQALQKFHCGDSVTLEPVFQYLKEL